MAEKTAEVQKMGDTADKLRYAFAGGAMRTEILGSNKLIFEGCDGVICYSSEEIGLRSGRRGVWISGRNLRIICMDEDSAVISGQIGEVRFR
jgi:sporulation protein YqfC